MNGSRVIRQLVVAVIGLAALAGCATADRRADILYRPAANAKGGSGDLYLVQDVRPPAGEAAGIEWVLGKTTDKDGKTVGRIVTDTAPARLVMDALNRELQQAGYNVIVMERAPEQPLKALRLKEVTVRLDVTHSVVKDESSCTVKMSVEPWRRGAAAGVAGYEAQLSDTALVDREQLPPDTLQKTLQLLMSRAVPEIVRTLEQK